MSRFFIYVPQGRTARLISASKIFNVAGLYTDGFSTCNLIVFIGPGRISLTHADFMANPANHQEEEKWVGTPCQCIVVRRMLGAFQTETLLAECTQKPIIYDAPDTEVAGISVSFESRTENSVHPQITLHHEQLTENILRRHPDEKRFLVAHKMEQILITGQEERFNKQNLIFDGRFWEALDEKEFHPYCIDDFSRDYLGFLKPNESTRIVSGRLMGIIDALQKRFPQVTMVNELKKEAISTGVYAVLYLNQYDPKKVLCLDINDLIHDTEFVTPYKKYPADEQLEKELIQILADKNIDAAVQKIWEKYLRLEETEYSHCIMKNLEAFLQWYKIGEGFSKSEALVNQQKQYVKEVSFKLVILYKAQQYVEAAEAFRKLLVDAAYCFKKNDPELGILLHNLGQALFHSDECELAKTFLQWAYTLKQAYSKDPLSVGKTKTALEACLQKYQEVIVSQQSAATSSMVRHTNS